MEKIYREGGRKKKRVNAHRSRPILFEAESEEEEEFELEVEVNNPKKNWTCAACTFRNKYSSSFCTLCHQDRYQQSESSQEEEEEQGALQSELRTVRQRLVPKKKPDHNPFRAKKRALDSPPSTPKKALVRLATAKATTTTTATVTSPFVFGAPPSLSSTTPGGLFGVFDSSKMVIKFTGGSENETMKQEKKEKEKNKEEEEVEESTSDKEQHKGAQAVYELSVPELEKQIKTLDLSLVSVNATKADLTERLTSVEAQITDLTDRKTLLQALVKIRKDNERLEKEANRAQQRRTEVEDAIAQARRELEALSLERDQRTEELERVKQEKIEIKQLAAKKKEVEDLASELESRKTAADALRARLEEAETTLAADRESLDEERQALAEEKLKMNNLQEFASRKVKLNVGGTYFQTSLTTLTQVPSMFSAMFSGKYRMEADEDGCYFIDRDPTHFRYVLNFLRDSRIEVPVEGSKALVRELLAEAEFYQVEGLIALLAPDDHDAASGGGAPPFAFTFSSSTPPPSAFSFFWFIATAAHAC
ncbi:K+ channel tetramerization subfamily protein [Acanthamoeba castellanii str. Neff]|uniref:K+ channel tetramerisation subfamily protein n=1 Tax=Acanthamoeba castellanii (strain ATCC 30010 / Neff) TaxID=1257118 RepID=M0QSM4_ACACF|nr:K+ channel tetramerization subfamily protein [Acanthamoeba castellanii str. Neff]ELR14880.1 K+ channel tetramerisation subfamily protein [Acanthamoeba castellanii str. Neff]